MADIGTQVPTGINGAWFGPADAKPFIVRRRDCRIVMWLLVARPPRPDAAHWPGRRLLAVLDAVGWPAAWMAVIAGAPAPLGLLGATLMALAAWSGVGRLHRAWRLNHRYQFTTWRWARGLGVLLLIGLVLKFTTTA